MYWHLSVQNAETKRNAVRSGRTFGAQVPHTWLPAITSAVIGVSETSGVLVWKI